jgi:hypothetical protein
MQVKSPMKSRWKAGWILLVVFSILGGCQLRIQYPSELPSEEVIVEELDYWYWGTEGDPSFEIYDRCPQGRVYETRMEASFTQGLVSVATLGIYTPRTLTITCSLRGAPPQE